MENYFANLAKIHNTLLCLHPTGEDILIVAQMILEIRSMMQPADNVHGSDAS